MRGLSDWKNVLQVRFHFRTTKCNGSDGVVDDSRKMSGPMELVLGKQFKLEVWEAIVQKMALHEIARFRVDKSVSQLFIVVGSMTQPIICYRRWGWLINFGLFFCVPDL